ncbi:MAG: DNA cytosine methyltransferase [Phycisphaerales bacterium]
MTDHLWNYLQQYAAKHKAKGNGFGFGMTDLDGVSRTISARYHKDGSEILIPRGKGKNPRRLTIVEAARLMGFGELVTTREDMPVSDTQAYRQFGNAVVPAVVKAVGEQVVKVMVEHHREATNGCFLKGRKDAQVVEVKPVRKHAMKKKPAKRGLKGATAKPSKASELQKA